MTTEVNQNFIKELKMNKELNGRAPVERRVIRRFWRGRWICTEQHSSLRRQMTTRYLKI